MNKEDYKYTYELHFPMTKEVFYSNQEPEDFLSIFNQPQGRINIHGDRVVLVRNGGGIGIQVCYLKQIDNERDFVF